MWSDPSTDMDGFALSPRGAGYIFGKQVVDRFAEINQVDHIARAHQMCMEGYQELFNNKCLTVWSAPNYCYRCGNMASVLKCDGNRNWQIYGAAPNQEDESKTSGILNGVHDQANQWFT